MSRPSQGTSSCPMLVSGKALTGREIFIPHTTGPWYDFGVTQEFHTGEFVYFTVKNPITCVDYNHLIGREVRVNNQLWLVIDVIPYGIFKEPRSGFCRGGKIDIIVK